MGGGMRGGYVPIISYEEMCHYAEMNSMTGVQLVALGHMEEVGPGSGQLTATEKLYEEVRRLEMEEVSGYSGGGGGFDGGRGAFGRGRS